MNKTALRFAPTAILAAIAATGGLIACSNVPSGSSEASSEAPERGWSVVPAKSGAVRISGYTDWGIDGDALTGWSGAAYTIGFNGTALKMMVKSGPAIYDIFVDGEEDPSDTLNLVNRGADSVFTVVENLAPGTHYVRIQKNTEHHIGQALFLGFLVKGEAAPEALPPLPERRLEFIGNSITCGFGVLSPDAESAADSSFEFTTEDHYYSYAGQATRILGAEERTVCISGRGVLRNFDNSTEGILPDIYRELDSYNPGDDSARWIPDIVLVNLGTNDFGKGTPDSTAFTKAVYDFAGELRTKYPQAAIVLLSGPMLTGKHRETCIRFLDAAAERSRENGDANIYRFDFDPQGDLGYGGNYHPNQAQALKDAESLAAWIQETFRW